MRQQIRDKILRDKDLEKVAKFFDIDLERLDKLENQKFGTIHSLRRYKSEKDFYQGVYAPNFVRELANVGMKSKWGR